MRSVLLLWIAATALAQENNPLGSKPEAVEQGRQTFLGACSACHGASAQGGTGPSLLSGRVNRLRDRALFLAIKNGLPGTDMPPFALPDDKLWQLVSFLRNITAPAIEANVPGDAARGAVLFQSHGCAGCHSIAGKGGAIGPDLSNIGMARTLFQLRESVFQPSARIEQGFEAVEVQLPSGPLSGVLKNGNNYSLQILDAKGQLHLLSRTGVRSFQKRKESLMPAGYSQKLSKTEADDLLAYLSQRTIRP